MEITTLKGTVDDKTKDLETMRTERAKDGSSIIRLEKEVATLERSLESKSNFVLQLEEQKTKDTERFARVESEKHALNVSASLHFHRRQY